MISQSGETKDLINIVHEGKKKKNVKTVGIINVEGSTLAIKTNHPIYINVGRSISRCTKGFFHQVLNLIYYATLIAERKQSADMN
jgi:glucosamine 6-phosphate synthetase-like amidotransferase/phosphosugar isomerase protein